MDAYQISFAGLIASNVVLGAWQYRRQNKSTNREIDSEKDGAISEKKTDERAISHFRWEFMPVYLLVVGADWLQGPYIYTLYKDEKRLEEGVVAMLFMTGFVSGAVSAFFVGALADCYGRRAACLVFCILYSLSCATVLVNNLLLLFVGRALGGISATLLYSVFETWMVTEYHQRGLKKAGMDLSAMFGDMTTFSSIVAIIAGVVSQFLVAVTMTDQTPFMASIVCLVIATALITQSWQENYGKRSDDDSFAALKAGSTTLLSDKRIMTLGLTVAFFEGVMFLFIFYKTPALTTARVLGGKNDLPPFGMIFACLMSAMMSGSMLFTLVNSSQKVWVCAGILSTVVALASCCLLVVPLSQREMIIFWAFCLYEACIGLYYPSMGFLKGTIVEDGDRGKIYSAMRLPLNAFVIAALSLTQEGSQHRNMVFMFCGGLLLAVSILILRVLARKPSV